MLFDQKVFAVDRRCRCEFCTQDRRVEEFFKKKPFWWQQQQQNQQQQLAAQQQQQQQQQNAWNEKACYYNKEDFRLNL